MSKHAIAALDCNGTLVHVHHIFSADDRQFPDVQTYQRDGFGKFKVIPRPSAAPFLSKLRELGIICSVVTGGSSRHQRLILNIADLGRLSVHGAGEFGSIPKLDNFVLVDDGDPTSPSVTEKLAALSKVKRSQCNPGEWEALVARHFIRCAEFRGGSDPQPLTDLVDEICNKLGIEKKEAP